MTVQLTKAQIDAIKCELAKFGLDVKAKAKPKIGMDHWAKRHAARMSRTMRNVAAYGRFKDAIGAHSYQVRGLDGQWHDETSPGFDTATQYQKGLTAIFKEEAGERERDRERNSRKRH